MGGAKDEGRRERKREGAEGNGANWIFLAGRLGGRCPGACCGDSPF